MIEEIQKGEINPKCLKLIGITTISDPVNVFTQRVMAVLFSSSFTREGGEHLKHVVNASCLFNPDDFLEAVDAVGFLVKNGFVQMVDEFLKFP